MRFSYGFQNNCTLYGGQESFTTPQRDSEVDFACPTVPANTVSFNQQSWWVTTGTAANGTAVYQDIEITIPKTPWFTNTEDNDNC
ncbi:hypothetical protein BT69DRAFT_1278311 [Atractiella rhizophila]|nr:hypothetical protein BT69DRAFT_1278311 [Atractiella rhizophila]